MGIYEYNQEEYPKTRVRSLEEHIRGGGYNQEVQLKEMGNHLEIRTITDITGDTIKVGRHNKETIK